MAVFDGANKGQLEAITITDGPVLIIAGHGTGKTYTLVQRTIRLITECGVEPGDIFLTTFTEKAAKELLTRITSELSRRDIKANVQDMYIGTFHSLCLRIIKEHLEYSRLKRNYRILDGFEQSYTIYRNLWKFNEINGFDSLFVNEETGRFLPHGFRTLAASTASTSVTSWQLAPVTTIDNGSPCSSTSVCLLVPFFPVGRSRTNDLTGERRLASVMWQQRYSFKSLHAKKKA